MRFALPLLQSTGQVVPFVSINRIYLLPVSMAEQKGIPGNPSLTSPSLMQSDMEIYQNFY